MSGDVKKVKDIDESYFSYLTLIQGNIARMAGNSAIMKGFSATLIATLLGMFVSDDLEWYHIAIAVIPLISFIRLDVYYLQLERKYRNLYSIVAANQDLVIQFRCALDLKSPDLDEYQSQISEKAGFFKTLFSASVWKFYIWFLLFIATLIIFAA